MRPSRPPRCSSRRHPRAPVTTRVIRSVPGLSPSVVRAVALECVEQDTADTGVPGAWARHGRGRMHPVGWLCTSGAPSRWHASTAAVSHLRWPRTVERVRVLLTSGPAAHLVAPDPATSPSQGSRSCPPLHPLTLTRRLRRSLPSPRAHELPSHNTSLPTRRRTGSPPRRCSPLGCAPAPTRHRPSQESNVLSPARPCRRP
jgi:hypothetical protein